MIRKCWIVLFDRKGHLVDLHPPPDTPWKASEVIGMPAWAGIAAEHQESFRAAFARVVKERAAVVWDGRDVKGTLWRNWMFPMERRRIVAAIVRKWPPLVARLTVRDRAICAGIAVGELAKETANRLGTAAGTIKNRRGQIAKKLGLHASALAGWCGLHEEWLS